MNILVNEQNEIVAYANHGDIDGATAYSGAVPDGFEENFKQNFYLFKDGEIVANDDYQEPVIADPEPTEAQQQLAQVAYQQMMTVHDFTALQTQNAQMAYQLMIQQGGQA